MSGGMKMPEDRVDHFDSWAANYDQSVGRDQTAAAYPFAGYDEVVEGVVALAQFKPDHTVLDIGAGTGNLTAKLVEMAGDVWGTDFSENMLAKARQKVSQARFVRWDMQDDWPPELPAQFDRIVSTYALHHLDDEAKVCFLTGLATKRLRPAGHVVIGDIAFPDDRAQAACQQAAANDWDDSEHYWIASRIIPQLEDAGFMVGYKQISFCGGLFVLQPKDAA
jgi:putative AdoMet-dependent methyltransferase